MHNNNVLCVPNVQTKSSTVSNSVVKPNMGGMKVFCSDAILSCSYIVEETPYGTLLSAAMGIL